MTREQGQVVRLLLMCAAWAVGTVLTFQLGVSFATFVVPAVLAVGVYVLTEDLGKPGGFGGGGNVKYWRGRPVDDDERRRGRWN